jgi:NADH:ubiquinone reductase (non-electrogenic)
MASAMRATMKLPASSVGFTTAAHRSFATSSFGRATLSSRNLLDKSKLNQSFRRGYAELTKPTTPIAEAKQPKRFRALRWTWRLTYLSVIGGIAYMSYGVYELRHPDDQFEPDPTKQNLVILGICSLSGFSIDL